MRTRSATRESGMSPGREHELPPPTRKKRAPRAKAESGPVATASPKRAAEEPLVGRSPVRRRVEPECFTPPVKRSFDGGAVRRLLASVNTPRRVWRRRRPGPALSPIVEADPVTPERRSLSLEGSGQPPKRKRSPSPEIGPATRRQKRRRASPEVIPNPPGTSYGMWDKYFIVYSSDSDEEDKEAEVDMDDEVPVPHAAPTPDPATIRYPHNTSGEGVFCVNLDDILDAAEAEEAEEEKELAELAEKQLAEEQQMGLAAKQQTEFVEKQQRELAEAESAANIPDALSKARALALKHKPETSSRLRFVERLSTSTVGTDLNDEMILTPVGTGLNGGMIGTPVGTGLNGKMIGTPVGTDLKGEMIGTLTQAEEDEVRAAVAAIAELDLMEFDYPRACSAPGVTEEENWRAAAAIPEMDLIQFDFPRAFAPGVSEKEVWRAVLTAAPGTRGMEVLPLFG